MRTSLDPQEIRQTLDRLEPVDALRRRRYPGETGSARQPVHTCYVPADKVDSELLARWSGESVAALDAHAATPQELSANTGLPAEFADSVLPRIRAKLHREPVEDLRIDFEDGYGVRADADEDADAERTARVVAEWVSAGTRPPYFGLRVKSFDTPWLRERCVRTLDVFLTTLLAQTGGVLPSGFLLTFPKITDVTQVEVFADTLSLVEHRFGLGRGVLGFEIQIETTQSIVDSEGRLVPPQFINAGAGRVTALHFGTYDYTAGCGLSAAHQHLAHGACDFARHVMQVSAAGTGVQLSDGSTNVLPVGDAEKVRHGWRTHYALVRRSLEHGFYQSWDMHPAQLVTRYAAVFAAFLDTVQGDAARLSAYVSASGGAVLDEPATAQALAVSFLRALDNGATDEDEVKQLTGLSREDLAALSRREAVRT